MRMATRERAKTTRKESYSVPCTSSQLAISSIMKCFEAASEGDISIEKEQECTRISVSAYQWTFHWSRPSARTYRHEVVQCRHTQCGNAVGGGV